MNEISLKLVEVNMIRCRPGDWEHCKRVVEWVKKLGEGSPNLLLLETAAYMHDIGWRDVIPDGQKLTKEQLTELEPEANKNSVPYATDLLLEIGYDETQIQQVLPLIKAADEHHSVTPDEAIIVDADNLSKLNMDHLREKYQPDAWMKMVELWEQEFPKRIRTEAGKAVYPGLLADLRRAVTDEI